MKPILNCFSFRPKLIFVRLMSAYLYIPPIRFINNYILIKYYNQGQLRIEYFA